MVERMGLHREAMISTSWAPRNFGTGTVAHPEIGLPSSTMPYGLTTGIRTRNQRISKSSPLTIILRQGVKCDLILTFRTAEQSMSLSSHVPTREVGGRCRAHDK
jgi:hypothetical protein